MTFEQLKQFLDDPLWDAPFFKQLSNNDTHASSGHQGGPAIPKDIQSFFPQLVTQIATPRNPTVEYNLSFDGFIDGIPKGRMTGRYHFQTWGATRTPELRLTCLTPIYNASSGGDLLIFQRRKDSLAIYRVLLLTAQIEAYGEVYRRILKDRFPPRKCWGSLFWNCDAIRQSDVDNAHKEIISATEQPFIPIREDIPRNPSSKMAIARDVAFRSILLEQYGRKCAVSGIALETDSNAEVQAAHIVALSLGGADDPRNGFTLTGTLHWAFDNGLFCVEDNRKVIISPKALSSGNNEWLRQFNGIQIFEASGSSFKTAPEAFAWHRENIFWN